MLAPLTLTVGEALVAGYAQISRPGETIANLGLRFRDGQPPPSPQPRSRSTSPTPDRDYLGSVTAKINDRPRKILNWKKPSEELAEILAANGPAD